MDFSISYSSIDDMLKLFSTLKKRKITKSDIENVLKHPDYKFEFARYNGRVCENDFIDYILNLNQLDESNILNEDLKIHHKYYRNLLDNLDFYIEKSKELKKLTRDLFENQIEIALNGLPNDMELPHLNFIFTIGIGQSFGYIYKNGMHFDFLQLAKDKSIDELCSTLSHEIHHIGTNIMYEKIDLESIPLEAFFYLYFSGEGLAVKYCNNAEGVLSKNIHAGPKNIGLDSFSWEYLNKDFYNTMKHFKNTISKIRDNSISSMEDLEKDFYEYWMNPYTDDQDKREIPKLKQSRLYSFGNDIWGIIHDCFGKDIVFQTIKNPETFQNVFNKSLEKLGHSEFQIL